MVLIIGTVYLPAIGSSNPEYSNSFNPLSAIYAGLSKLCWGLAVGWIIYACATGYGGTWRILYMFFQYCRKESVLFAPICRILQREAVKSHSDCFKYILFQSFNPFCAQKETTKFISANFLKMFHRLQCKQQRYFEMVNNEPPQNLRCLEMQIFSPLIFKALKRIHTHMLQTNHWIWAKAKAWEVEEAALGWWGRG